jgi:hypothetical protein
MGACSLDGAQRNPGPLPPRFPDFATLHPGYGLMLVKVLQHRRDSLALVGAEG